MLAVWLGAILAPVCALSVLAGGGGRAVFIDYLQGMYISDFPIPERTLTVELWTKPLQV